MKRRNFRILTFSLLFAGLAIMMCSLFAKLETTKTLLLSSTAVFYLGAAINIVVYKARPKSFGDKTKDLNG